MRLQYGPAGDLPDELAFDLSQCSLCHTSKTDRYVTFLVYKPKSDSWDSLCDLCGPVLLAMALGESMLSKGHNGRRGH